MPSRTSMREQNAVAQGGAHRAGIASGGLLLDRSSDFSVLSAVERNVVAAGEPVAFEFRRQCGAGHRGKNEYWEDYFAKLTCCADKSQPRVHAESSAICSLLKISGSYC